MVRKASRAIEITGAAEHNLKNIDLSIPRDRMVVITGISGSGKSSLAFDTVYAEGRRKYVESLSAYARQFLSRLRDAGELVDLHQPVDIRHIATLVDQSDKALFFHNVIGYDVPVVSGIIRSQKRAIMSLGCKTYPEIEAKLKAAIDRPIASNPVNTSPTQEVGSGPPSDSAGISHRRR